MYSLRTICVLLILKKCREQIQVVNALILLDYVCSHKGIWWKPAGVSFCWSLFCLIVIASVWCKIVTWFHMKEKWRNSMKFYSSAGKKYSIVLSNDSGKVNYIWVQATTFRHLQKHSVVTDEAFNGQLHLWSPLPFTETKPCLFSPKDTRL